MRARSRARVRRHSGDDVRSKSKRTGHFRLVPLRGPQGSGRKVRYATLRSDSNECRYPARVQSPARRFDSPMSFRSGELREPGEQGGCWGTTPQKKHLLHRVVREVRVHEDRRVVLCRVDPKWGSHTGANEKSSPTASVCEPDPDASKTPILAYRGTQATAPGLYPPALALVTSPTKAEVIVKAAELSRPTRPGPTGQALVWRALLAIQAVRSRAEIARWQGISRAASPRS
jgi:hypothetical protein